MTSYTVIFVLFLTIVQYTECSNKAGIKIRLTKKAWQYALDTSMKILKVEIMKSKFHASGTRGNTSYYLNKIRLYEVHSTPSFTLIPNVGMSVQVRGISLKGRGNVVYKDRKGKLQSGGNFAISVSGAFISAVINIIATSDGRPDFELKSCNEGAGSVDLRFHEERLKGMEKELDLNLPGKVCNLIHEYITGKIRPILANFPVTKQLDEGDKWIEVDYRLTQSPKFAKNYVDVFLKGELRSNNKKSRWTPPSFPMNDDQDKMIYAWVSDYALNTAMEVIIGRNKPERTFEAWDEKIHPKILNTNEFKIVIPNLSSYSDLPMLIRIVPYKLKVIFKEGSMHLLVNTSLAFSIKYNNGSIFEAFKLQLDIDITGAVIVRNTPGRYEKDKRSLKAIIEDFNYDIKVVASNIGKITISNGLQLMANLVSLMVGSHKDADKLISKALIINYVNLPLQESFYPLPDFDNVALDNVDVIMQKGAIRIGADMIFLNRNVYSVYKKKGNPTTMPIKPL